MLTDEEREGLTAEEIALVEESLNLDSQLKPHPNPTSPNWTDPPVPAGEVARAEKGARLEKLQATRK